MTAPTPKQQQVIAEHEDLCARLHELGAFISGKAFAKLPETEKALLVMQKSAMEIYRETLAARIHLWESKLLALLPFAFCLLPSASAALLPFAFCLLP